MIKNVKTLAVAACIAATTMMSINAIAGGPDLTSTTVTNKKDKCKNKSKYRNRNNRFRLRFGFMSRFFGVGASNAFGGMATGVYFGLGGGYNTEQLRSQFLTSEDRSTLADDLISRDAAFQANNQTYNLAPTAELGYMNYLFTWMFGVKTMYTYLHSTTILDESAIFRTESENEVTLLFMLGKAFDLKNVGFIGVGPSELNLNTKVNLAINVTDTNHDEAANLTNSLNFNRNVNRWLWGGSVQLGWLHYFSRTWFLSATYTYSIFANGNYNYEHGPEGATVTTLAVNHTITANSQKIVVGLNKTFSL